MNNNIKSIFNKYINSDILKKINQNNLIYKDYIIIYNKINCELIKKNITSFEINSFLKNSDFKIKNFVKKKNKFIYKKAIDSNLWELNINKYSKSKKDKKILNLKIKKRFNNNYINDWNGFWTMIKISKKGEIKNIDLIDIDDIEFILN